MSLTEEFLESCSRTLEETFGPISNGIIKFAESQKKLNEFSNIRDLDEFIDLIEKRTRGITGKTNAANVCQTLRTHVMELNVIKDTNDVFRSLNTEATDLNINEFLKSINVTSISSLDTGSFEGTTYLARTSMNDEIDHFLKKNSLPGERDITRYANDLASENGSEAEKLKKDIINKVKIHVKNDMTGRLIREEITNFLMRYPEPEKTDVDDFLEYLNLMKLNFTADELRQKIEDQRLHSKFHEPIDMESDPQIGQLIGIIKTCNDKNEIISIVQEQDIRYLIEDESGLSEKLLFELIEQIILIEKDTLNGLLLKRLVRKAKKNL